MAPPPQAPAPKAVAPGAWWQRGTQHEQPAGTIAQQPAHDPTGYHPAQAQGQDSISQCPRCGSGNYAHMPVDLSMGGSSAGALLAQSGGKVKRCFDCRYPNLNASGDVVRGAKGAVHTTDARALKVRQGNIGGVSLGSIMNNAVNIDAMVS